MKMVTVTNEWREMSVGVSFKIAGDIEEFTDAIPASVFGCFAVHRSVNMAMNWALTHIPTGRLVKRYDMVAFSKNDVAEIAVKLHELHGDVWNTESIKKTQELLLTCKDIWRVKTPAEAS